MTTNSSSGEPGTPSHPAGRVPAETEPGLPVTRAGMVWAASAVALVLLVLLIIFILQNQDEVSVDYFGLTFTLPLGMALLIAAVAGGALVAIAGGARILQLRSQRNRSRSASTQSGERLQ